MIKKIIKETLKLFFLQIIKKLPSFLQIYPFEIFRLNKIYFNKIEILYEPSSELSNRRWKAFEMSRKEENPINWINNFEKVRFSMTLVQMWGYFQDIISNI